MVYSVIVKTGAFLTAILAITVIGIAGFTLSSTFDKDMYEGSTNETTEYENLTTTSPEQETAATIPPISYKSKMENNVSQKYKTVIQVSAGGSVFAGLIQLSLSWMVICGNMKNIRERVKIWQLANFIVFVLIVVCILVPMTFRRRKDSFIGLTTFWKHYILTKSTPFLDRVKDLTFSTIFNEILGAYFTIIFINDIILFLFLNLTCCCLCFGCKETSYRNIK